MTKHKQKEADNAALEILRSTGADVLEAALVSRTAMEAARGKVKQEDKESVRFPLFYAEVYETVSGAGEAAGAEHHDAGVRGIH